MRRGHFERIAAALWLAAERRSVGRLQRPPWLADQPLMARSTIAAVATCGVLASAVVSLWAYHLGHSHGVEMGLATGTQIEQVTHGVAAFSVIQHLEAERYAEALAELDAQVDAGISAHWMRLKAPSFYSDTLDSPADLVAYLEQYRRSRPSSTRDQTPHMNRMVAEYLASRDRP